MNRITPIILTLIVYCLGSCQQTIEEIDSDVSETNLVAESNLKQLITYSALKDGSFDNILDNASSISVKLPVTVLANAIELTIETESDFSLIEDVFNDEPFVRDSLLFQYPITIIDAFYSEMIVESRQQMDLIVSESIEGGDDPDIECFSYQYPFKISLYDKINQRASTSEVEDDKHLYELLNQLDDNLIAAIKYPVTILDDQGEFVEIQENSSLESLLESRVSSCDEGDNRYYLEEDDIHLPTTTLSILLTDAPYPTDLIAEANITINQIKLKSENESEEGNFLILSEEEMSFNLLELTNGLTATLVDIQVPTGNYDEIRLIVEDASVLLNDGEFFDLKVPSGSTSGIKVKLNPVIQIEEGENYEILLDFDVSQSFVVKGNPNTPAGIKGFNFKPVIKAADLSQSGSIGGLVTDQSTTAGIEGIEISVFAADTLNTTTFTDEDGEYKVLGLAAGTYEITADHDDFDAQTINSIEVEVKKETEVNIELTPN